MNSDIRLQMSFYSNTKIKKLHKALGSDGVLSLVFLWLYTAENRPHGELRGMDADDIALAAQYQGDSENFVSTLKDMGFLDKKGKLYIVHDWEINNPWAANAPERKKQAQEAAKARWLKNKGKTTCSQHTDSMLPAYAPSPSPLPTPLPKDKKILSEYSDEFLIFWNVYPKTTGKGAAWESWKKKKPDIDKVLMALTWQKQSRTWQEGFIPLPATYINQRRWEDEPEKTDMKPPALRGVN